MKLLRPLLVGLVALAFAGAARAQFVVTALTSTSTFSGLEQVISFDSLNQGDPITTQFVSQDVTFSTALIASTNVGDTNLFPNNAGGVIATNWTLTNRQDTWTLTFSVPQKQVVFLVEMNTNDSLQLTTSLNSVTHGSVSRLSPGTTPQYFGVQDFAGFDSLTFTVTGTDNHFFAMDSLRFEAVPEPTPLPLMALGLVGIGVARRRREAAGGKR